MSALGNLPTPTDKDSSKKAAPGGVRRWNRERSAYVCADGAKVQVRSGSTRLLPHGSEDKTTRVNEIFYRIGAGKTEALLLVSWTLLDRDMSQIVLGLPKIRTITFPSTVRIVQDGAFCRTLLMSAVLNEGLEKLGECPGNSYSIFC